MPIVAFDNLEFRRGGFYTPLGAGVWFKDEAKFRKVFHEAQMRLAGNFGLEDGLLIRSSTYLKYGIGLIKAIPFCDSMIMAVQDQIKAVQFNYVIIPPSKVSEVEVGGLGAATERIKTAEYLRNLSPAFSHIMAWSFLGKSWGGIPDWEMQLDGFQSKYTEAWDDLCRRVTPKVFPHGDECNPFINIADLIAFMTNMKLGAQMIAEKRKLNPGNLADMWSDYSFEVDTHYFDASIQYKLAWRSDEMIDLGRYYTRPMTFVMVDPNLKEPPKQKKTEVEEMMENEPAELSGVKPKVVRKPKFREWFEKSDPGIAIANYAYLTGGGFQHFDRHIDEDKIKNGDTLVYAGPDAKRLAQTYADMYDVKVISVLDLRKDVEKLRSKA